MNTIRYTHSGWLGICPVLLSMPRDTLPVIIVARRWWWYPAYFVSEAIIGSVVLWIYFINRAVDPRSRPIVRVRRLRKDIWK